MLILCMSPQVINKIKFMHQGEGHIKVKVKISTSLQILCSPYSLQAGGLHYTEYVMNWRYVEDVYPTVFRYPQSSLRDPFIRYM